MTKKRGQNKNQNNTAAIKSQHSVAPQGVMQADQSIMEQFQQWFATTQNNVYDWQTNLIEKHKNKVKWLHFPAENINFLMAVIYTFLIFGVAVFSRYWYLYQHGDTASISFEGNHLFVSPDAYYFAEYILNALREGWTPETLEAFDIQAFPALYALSVYLCKIFQIHPDKVLVYLPIVLGALVVFPVVAIGRIMGSTKFGLFSAVIISIASIYFRRTRMGYFDSDIFAITALMTGLYCGLVVLRNPTYIKIAILTIVIAIYPLFDKQVIGNVIYILILVLFMIRWHKHPKFHSMLLLFLVAGLELGVWQTLLTLAVVGFLMWIFHRLGQLKKLDDNPRWTIWLLVVAAIIILTNQFFITVFNYFILYVLRTAAYGQDLLTRDGLLAFKLSTSTISELQTKDYFPLSFESTTSQHHLTWGLMGFVLLLFVYPSAIVFLPFLFLGVMAMSAGIRFSLFLVVAYPFSIIFLAYALNVIWRRICATAPIMQLLIVLLAHIIFFALYEGLYVIDIYLSTGSLDTYKQLGISSMLGGFATYQKYPAIAWIGNLYPVIITAMIFLIAMLFSPQFKNKVAQFSSTFMSKRSVFMEKSLTYCFSVLPLAIMLCVIALPSYKLVKNFPARVLSPPQSFTPLTTAQKVGNPTDVIYSWWDYGYLLSYYSDMNTIVDGRQPNIDDYLISKAFSSDSPRLMANIFRYVTEKRKFVAHESLLVNLLSDYRHPTRVPYADLFIERMRSPTFKVYDFVNRTTDAYIYMNHYFLLRHSVIKSFSNHSLEASDKRLYTDQLYYYSRSYSTEVKDGKNLLHLDANRWIDLNSGNFHEQNQSGEQQTVRINTLSHGRVGEEGYVMNSIVYDPNSKIFIIAIPSVGVFFMDKRNYNANYLQMYIFDNYDEQLYEVIERNSTSVLFRLKL